MKIRECAPPAPTLAAPLAAEDVCIGDDVAILNETYEFPSFLWNCDGTLLSPHELVRIQCVSRDDGLPQKVEAVCLPFVFLKTPTGEHRTVDIRRVQLVRLDKAYAKHVRRKLRRKIESFTAPLL